MIRRWWWVFCKWLAFILGVVLWRLRYDGLRRLPRKGGALLAANHQSYPDPVLIGVGLPREIHFMARRSLFRNPIFGMLIRSLNAFEVERDAADLKAIRHALQVLRRGDLLLVFPEGTRSRDGSIGPMKAGIGMLAERTGVPVVPVLIEGAHAAWPKGRLLPGMGNVRVTFGEPFRPVPGMDVGQRVRESLLRLKGEWKGCRTASS